MGLSNARVQSSNNLSSRPEASSKKVGWVLEVLLDENTDYAKAKKIGAQPIGSIHFTTSDDGILETDPAARTIAHPFDKNNFTFPIKGETVIILEIDKNNTELKKKYNQIICKKKKN